jgi:hypothetical protein
MLLEQQDLERKARKQAVVLVDETQKSREFKTQIKNIVDGKIRNIEAKAVASSPTSSIEKRTPSMMRLVQITD